MWAIGKKEKCVVKESIGNSIGKVADWLLMRSCCLHRELTAVLYDNLERWDGVGGGKEVQEGGHVYILRAGLHCCMAEANTIL